MFCYKFLILERNRESYLHMDIDSARMIETFSKTKLETEKYEEEEEEINMCKAIDDMIKEAEQKAEQKGVQRKLIEQVCKKVKKNKPVTVIAEELEESVEDIVNIYDIVLKYAPDYNLDMICNEIASYN